MTLGLRLHETIARHCVFLARENIAWYGYGYVCEGCECPAGGILQGSVVLLFTDLLLLTQFYNKTPAVRLMAAVNGRVLLQQLVDLCSV